MIPDTMDGGRSGQQDGGVMAAICRTLAPAGNDRFRLRPITFDWGLKGCRFQGSIIYLR